MNKTDSPAAVDQTNFAIRSIAKSAIDNEKHFGDHFLIRPMRATSGSATRRIRKLWRSLPRNTTAGARRVW